MILLLSQEIVVSGILVSSVMCILRHKVRVHAHGCSRKDESRRAILEVTDINSMTSVDDTLSVAFTMSSGFDTIVACRSFFATLYTSPPASETTSLGPLFGRPRMSLVAVLW